MGAPISGRDEVSERVSNLCVKRTNEQTPFHAKHCVHIPKLASKTYKTTSNIPDAVAYSPPRRVVTIPEKGQVVSIIMMHNDDAQL